MTIADSPLDAANALAHNSADSFAIAFAPLDLAEVYQLADDGANGAIILMSGMVRNQTDGQPVVALEYQAYEPMALAVFQQIASLFSQFRTSASHHDMP